MFRRERFQELEGNVNALIGDDGWLFLSGDSNDVLGQLTGRVGPPRGWVRHWGTALAPAGAADAPARSRARAADRPRQGGGVVVISAERGLMRTPVDRDAAEMLADVVANKLERSVVVDRGPTRFGFPELEEPLRSEG